MFCSNCGNQIPDVAKFCPKCGSRVNTEEVKAEVAAVNEEAVPAAAEEAYEAEAAGFAAEPAQSTVVPAEKKKFRLPDIRTLSKKTLIIGSAAVLAVILLVVFNFRALANFTQKAFMSDEQYYQYVEAKGLEDMVSTVGSIYEEYLEICTADSVGSDATVSLELGDEARNLMSIAAGTDFSWFENVTMDISANSGWKSMISEGSATIGLNGEDVISANVYMDIQNGAMYLQIPEFSDAYMVEYIGQGDYSDMMEMYQPMGMLAAVFEACPDRAAVEKIANRYIGAVLEGVTDVKESSGKLSAGGVSNKYTTLKVTFDAKTMQKILVNAVEEFIDDDEIKDIIIDVVPTIDPTMDGRMIYDEIISSAEYYLEEIKSEQIDMYSNEELFEMTVYVDAKGEIVGRKINSYGNEITLAMPEEGGDTGFELSYTDGYDYAGIVGKGEMKGGLFSGKLHADYGETSLMTIAVSDFDTESIKDGYLNGSVNVSLTEEGIDMLRYEGDVDEEALVMLAKYSVGLSFGMSEESSSMGLSILGGNGEPFAELTMSGENKTGGALNRPAGIDSALTEDEWIYTVDTQAVMERLMEVLPSELVDAMNGGVGYDDYGYAGGFEDYAYSDVPVVEEW